MDQTPSIKIFRPGRFTSMEGAAVDFSAADLEAIAAGYDGIADPAPLVVGHPKLDAPAYGWVEKLGVEDGRLVATPAKVDEGFKGAVKAGRYPKVSASFYPPKHPGNPKPGTYYLRHVGFLGGAAPGVSGLGTVSFADGEPGGLITLETDNQEPFMKTPQDEQAASFAARETAVAAREAKIAESEAALAEREKTAAEREAAAVHAASVSFAEAQVAALKLAPAGKELVIGILDNLEMTATVSFGAAGEMSPAAAFRKLFDGAKPVVALGEAAPAGDPDKVHVTTTVSFAAPPGHTVHEDSAKLHARAKRLMASDPNLSFWDAVTQAEGEAPAA